MKTLLLIRSSLLLGNSQSNRLADRYVAAWQAAHPEGRVVVRDLAQNPVPHLDLARVGAFSTPAEQRTPEQQALVAESDALIDELQSADVVALGLPLYNFGIPSTLKAYFDHIARAGVTFRYTASGPEGLVKGKQVVVFAARGGLYQGQPHDTQTPYVRNFLGFLGMTDVRFVFAEGLNMGDEPRAQGLRSAESAIDSLLEPVTA
ncbi:MAG: FMN-dependent NADH-azoreductase [Hydrogenophaga sp.]|uniref:FMN-dependent NADH-azoreductase n=1 Tax=Hydrogenophaga sp. TaxID=1904254 RepID=UPI0016B22EC6|nr:NAD(P)H-dependent oxidoreductase [Hydrogenophaga sp.]NIM43793.1 FMN-dependent NADH-azoreductase [Hydrogenophaga sp.]NIN28859.1 FMN-dependent NADH-azoreductase [Hydrogenophaga sp.]NIN33318.1 FMN-dependent NADH-azoreductase [Hydrogenophaga sp.]NIN57993.1 FMN-dependent NADH-azoreductase [Hydrogenophaga sp.]NIO54291.1 FMN-dependent NADH-azoreductase [Hydrogenophaga sp.]